ncbi:MAG: TetR/AcrR family transcriptional regulator [Calditrichaeota bacterium]|nr:TetR/AcrR family transcriptional regulator [Calditrichota bacterium]MCB9367119.1 TetR/AcrR family transcriptional regulator [Calditrichota bacterium]MCB9391891.1 TetR/AcrR family transcriptional regulator [Calditrichota bacterium]
MTEHAPKDQRRIQILEAAGKLFASQGYEKTSVDEIAKEAGLSKGAVYWYFSSKEQILIGLAEQFEHQSQDAVVDMAAMEQLGPEALYLSHRLLYEHKLANPLPDLLFQQFVSMSSKYPDVADALDRNQQSWAGIIEGLTNNAVEVGYFKPTDTRMIAEVISALYRGTCTTRYDDPRRAYEIIEYTCKLIYDSLVTDKRKAELAEGAGA